jgi:DNA-binding LacI/PurR family transcriptional regulator
MAIGAMGAVDEAGLRIPDDISIMGLDDIEVSRYQVPPLTTVRQSFAELGSRGIELLLSILSGEAPAETEIILEPELCRDSPPARCGPGRSIRGRVVRWTASGKPV